jgi:hypothetical protein
MVYAFLFVSRLTIHFRLLFAVVAAISNEIAYQAKQSLFILKGLGVCLGAHRFDHHPFSL